MELKPYILHFWMKKITQNRLYNRGESSKMREQISQEAKQQRGKNARHLCDNYDHLCLKPVLDQQLQYHTKHPKIDKSRKNFRAKQSFITLRKHV